ncbi:hypothetical protein Tco_0894135 [Tanacetum coccineum]|uniref:Reverse transcriptase domain-containing protein n=1 Tax=Tanacetum coccineum TaxID=301880 RepID=A0ABQ5CDK9_9ASTR
MNPVATQQVALDNALVAPVKRLKIEKCNMRIEFNKPQRETTYQVTLDVLKLSPCYPVFLITAEKMPPRRGIRTRTASATATATTPMTDAAIRALIPQCVANALAEQENQRNTNLNGDGSQGSGSGITRPVRPGSGIMSPVCPTREMEIVFHISNYAVKNQVKFATCTLLGAALTWRMFLEESDEVEKYVGGLPDIIQGNVMTARPKKMLEAIELANELMDQKVRVYAERQAENKRKFDNNNQDQQQLPKRQNVAQAYAAGTSERKEYAGTLPLCNKCKFHHNGPCTAKFTNCKKVSYLTMDCWNPTATSN